MDNRIISIGYSEELISAMHVFLSRHFDLKGRKRTRIFISDSQPGAFDESGYKELNYSEVVASYD